ncbi:MAG: hypothetical protein KDE26_06000 [Bacteroidetes bacterium]|nr:hypothetical protein [Bacteroidota bacterium]
MILHLLWLAAVITAIELLTLHRNEDRPYEGWTKNYLEQTAVDSVIKEEASFSYINTQEKEESCHVCP